MVVGVRLDCANQNKHRSWNFTLTIDLLLMVLGPAAALVSVYKDSSIFKIYTSSSEQKFIY